MTMILLLHDSKYWNISAQPKLAIEQLLTRLKPRGFFAIMTKRVRDQAAFSQWHYKNDPTHIGFLLRVII